MPWSKAYARITWINEPSTDTPLNATNLNRMDVALNEVDNRVLQLQGSAYVHIKYSAYAAPTNIQMSETPDVYMGICVTSEETAPTQASTYTWNRVRGEKVVLQSANGYIQWKYENDANWTNIIALTELKGDTGAKGDTGTAATITISETTTSAAGGNASVENTGTSGAAVLKFTIPRGADGDDGREIELQKTATHIQWRYVGGEWANLVALADVKGAAGADGTDGDDGRGIVSVTRTDGTGAAGTTDTYTITYTDNTTSVFYVYNGSNGLGSGDMLKSVYDTDNNGVVDNAEKLGGQLPSYYAQAADIPNITGKADKVTTATAGNLAGLDSGGNLVDSGKKAADFAQASAIPDISGKADKVASAVTGNLASLDSNGNLADSGNKAADFALASAIPDISGKVNKAGDTMTGALTLSGDPTNNLHAATKKYVDDNATPSMVYYGTCTTAAGTVAKTSNVTGFAAAQLTAGVIVGLTFSNANTNTSATLNISSTGASSIRANGAAPVSGQIVAGMLAFFQYNGTYWVHINPYIEAVNISGKLDKSGGTMTGQLIAQANTAYTTYQVRNIALSTTAALPTGNGSLLGVYS